LSFGGLVNRRLPRTPAPAFALLAALAAAIPLQAQGGAPDSSEARTPLDSLPRVDTLPPAGVVESSYTITSGALALPGTLTLPTRASARRPPVVLIVAGSGPTDRNGNTVGPVGGVRANTYALLAWGLAARGVPSVRYDKRGLGASLRGLDLSKVTVADYYGDVAAAARQLAQDARFAGVVLLGHSEGAELVVQAANRGAPAAGLVLVSGIGRPLPQVLHEQLAGALDTASLVQFDSAFARYLRGEEPGTAPSATRALLLPMYRAFLQSMAAYDPAAELGRLAARRVPLLVVQGERDVQVSVVDARRLVAAAPGATLLLLPTANHVLKPAPSRGRAEQIKLYTDPSIALVPALVPALVKWVGKVGR
jgi:hypothetical protein